MSSVRDVAFLGGGFFCLPFRDENGFLLATLLGPAGRGIVGDFLLEFGGVGADVLYLDKALCWINSQLLGRITRIYVVESIT